MELKAVVGAGWEEKKEGGLCANPFNGIEREVHVATSVSPEPPYGIHSMELKVARLPEVARSVLDAVTNPFNGIERVSNVSKQMSPLTAVESIQWNWKTLRTRGSQGW